MNSKQRQDALHPTGSFRLSITSKKLKRCLGDTQSFIFILIVDPPTPFARAQHQFILLPLENWATFGHSCRTTRLQGCPTAEVASEDIFSVSNVISRGPTGAELQVLDRSVVGVCQHGRRLRVGLFDRPLRLWLTVQCDDARFVLVHFKSNNDARCGCGVEMPRLVSTCSTSDE